MLDDLETRVEDRDMAEVPLWRFLLYFLYLGTFGFGGPIALAGYMQRDLVERRRWISAEDYRVGLALAQLAPGPLAAQLAIYLGYVRGGFWGGKGTLFPRLNYFPAALVTAFEIAEVDTPRWRAASARERPSLVTKWRAR